MKDAHKSAIVIVAVISLLIVIAFYNNGFSSWGYPAPGAQQPGAGAFPLNPYIGQTFYYQGQNYVYGSTGWQPTTTPPSGTAGTYTIVDVAYNTLDISAALASTDVTQSFWGYRGGGWVLLGAHGASGTNVEVTVADGGFIYVMMEPESTDTYIADVAKVMAMNSRAVEAKFVDADGDNLNEFLVKWNMANIPAAASGYPSTTFTGYYLFENSASAAIVTGTDLTAVTTAAKISYFAPYMTIGTAKRGVAVFKIELKCNTTSTAKATLKSVNVPGKGLILASACQSYQLTDTYQIWTYTIGTDLKTAALWTYGANTFDKQDLTFGVQTTLASGDVIVWTLNIYELNYAQTVVIETDDMQMTYA
jgi:hypothetical protein